RWDVSSLLQNLGIFALATHIEAPGTDFAEAGRAPLRQGATGEGGARGRMRDGRSGLSGPQPDLHPLRPGRPELVGDPVRCRAMGAARRAFCRSDERFTPKAMGDRLEGAYYRWLKDLQK